MIGEDFATWRKKVPWRMASAGFTHALTDQVAAALESDDAEVALQEIYAGLHELDADALSRLHAEGVGVSLNLDLDAPARQRFGALYTG
jgi:hypothetical protein